MRTVSALILGATIAISVAVMWVTSKWATTIPEVASCALAAMWAIRFLTGRAQSRLSVMMIPIMGIVAWAGIQLLAGTTVYRWQTWMSVLYWMSNLATFFAASQIFRDAGLRTRFLRALVVFGFGVSIISSFP